MHVLLSTAVLDSIFYSNRIHTCTIKAALYLARWILRSRTQSAIEIGSFDRLRNGISSRKWCKPPILGHPKNTIDCSPKRDESIPKFHENPSTVAFGEKVMMDTMMLMTTMMLRLVNTVFINVQLYTTVIKYGSLAFPGMLHGCNYLPAIRAVATIWEEAEILFFLSGKSRTISPISVGKFFATFEVHNNVDRRCGENCRNRILSGRFFSKKRKNC